MAKKRFTDGLSNLFDNPFDEPETPAQNPTTADEENAAHKAPAEEESIEVDIPLSSGKARKKLSSKGFTNSLDSFLSDSFEREAAKQPASNGPVRSRRRRRGGLDLLIRSTVQHDDEDRNPRDAKAANTKRVTLIFRKDHLADLKELAKERKMYLKDLVQEMVAGYLEE